jgi:replication-associated recombination protein RarA
MEAAKQKITLLQKYFPRTWDDLILPSRIKKILLENQQKQGYRMIFFSSPGTGKTTTSRILTLGDDVMYLSGSNDFKIETLRSKVMAYAAGISVMQKQKTIIIDEFENVRNDLQDAFKIILDKAVRVNFIFITNEIEKVNEAILSRCSNLDYDFNGEDLEEHKRNYIKFAIDVAKAENIEFDKIGMRSLYQLNFPDFRHLLVHLQEIKDSCLPVTAETVKKFSESGKQIKELYEIIENQGITGKDLYSEITKFKGKERECLMSLGEPFFEYLNNKNLHEKTIESAMVVAKYSDMYVSSINKFVTFLTCVIELKSLFR